MGVTLPELKRRFVLKCEAPERVEPLDIKDALVRTKCNLTKSLLIGEQKASLVECIFYADVLHEIRVLINWKPVSIRGGSATAQRQLDDDVSLLRDAFTLKYPGALFKHNQWTYGRRYWTKNSYTWTVPGSGQVELIYRSAVRPEVAMEIMINSEAAVRLTETFNTAQSQLTESLRAKGARAATEEAQQRAKKAVSNL